MHSLRLQNVSLIWRKNNNYPNPSGYISVLETKRESRNENLNKPSY